MLSSLSTDISGEGDDMQVFLEVLNILRELDISIVKKKMFPLIYFWTGVIHKPCRQGMGMGLSIVLITTKAKVFE